VEYAEIGSLGGGVIGYRSGWTKTISPLAYYFDLGL